MFYLNASTEAWNSDSFNDTLKEEIRSIDPEQLPLQQGLAHSNFAIGDNVCATILHSEEIDGEIRIRAGLFYTGIITGCSCADDPTPIDENNEYCEVLFCIDRKTARTSVSLIE
ncbi:MAG TPA: hypothetical protein ENJ87_04950 [Gammaproteobacteria bacterium]|nr:hypothetical protein [Gammaproteobacteria bacterium]